MSDVSVIMYHYVREIKNSCFPELKGLETELFRGQLTYLKRHYNFVTMDEVINSVYNKHKLPSKAVLLTFDDGYKDHYNNVFPILKEFDVQGSFYVPAKAIKKNRMLDVNKIHFVLAAMLDRNRIISDIKLLIKKFTTSYDLKDFDFYYKKLAIATRFDSAEVVFIKRLLQVELNEELRYKILDILFLEYLRVDESEFAKGLYLSEDQIKEMVQAGMHIGCHGYDHYWWNRLESRELENEIDLSLEFLAEMGADISSWTAAYPYGSHSKEVEDMLNRKKCKLAFTTEVNVANTSSIENALILPRLDTNDIPKKSGALYKDWYRKSC